MSGLFSDFIYRAEQLAYEDATAAGFFADKPNPNAPITLDRLWEVCKKYLWGTSFLYQETTGNTYIFINNNYGYANEQDRRDQAMALMLVLAAMWLMSGIIFQRMFSSCFKFITNLSQNIVRIPMSILGYVAGGSIAAVAGVFLKLIYGRPYAAYVQTGAEVGSDVGSWAGKWIGWLAGIIPGAVVGTTLGFVAGLPIGALTLVVAPLQLIKTTYNAVVSGLNYISNKFQAILQRNSEQSRVEVSPTLERKLILQEVAPLTVNDALLEKATNVVSFSNTLNTALPSIATDSAEKETVENLFPSPRVAV